MIFQEYFVSGKYLKLNDDRSLLCGDLLLYLAKIDMMEKFRAIRRKDRVWDEAAARELLDRGEYGFLAMCGVGGYGYGLPMSYVADGDRIYFHCAPEGEKLDAIRENDRVSFCVVDRTRVIPRQFSTAYESVHLFGRIVVVGADEERLHALRLLIRKYSPEYAEIGEKYIAASFRRTVVLRLDIEHLAGKCKRIPPDAGMRPLE